MPKVKFLKTQTVQDGTGTTFEADSIYELPEASCERWVRRQVAERYTGSKKAVEPRIIVTPVRAAPVVASSGDIYRDVEGGEPKTQTTGDKPAKSDSK